MCLQFRLSWLRLQRQPTFATVVGHCLAAADVVLRPKISLETFSLKILQVDSDV